MKCRIEITGIDYQRNGVTGMGFQTVDFLFSEGQSNPKRLIAIIPGNEVEAWEQGKQKEFYWFNNKGGETPRTAVINPADLSDHWRGDRLGDSLLPAVAKYNNERYNYKDGNGKPKWIDSKEFAKTHLPIIVETED